MPIEVQLVSSADILENLIKADISKALGSLCEETVNVFEKELREVFTERVTQLELSDDTKRRWGIIKMSTGTFIEKVLDSIRVELTDDGASLSLDSGELKRSGISEELIVALLYGHPDGLPPLQFLSVAADRVDRAALAEEFFDALR